MFLIGQEQTSDPFKTCYTFTDKTTGKVMGFALILAEDHGKEQVKQQPPNRGVDECSLIQGSLASDLDIREDSSVNKTSEDTMASKAL